MSLNTLLFLHEVLCRQQLAVGAPDFRDVAQAVTVALNELDAAIEAARPPSPQERGPSPSSG